MVPLGDQDDTRRLKTPLIATQITGKPTELGIGYYGRS